MITGCFPQYELPTFLQSKGNTWEGWNESPQPFSGQRAGHQVGFDVPKGIYIQLRTSRQSSFLCRHTQAQSFRHSIFDILDMPQGRHIQAQTFRHRSLNGCEGSHIQAAEAAEILMRLRVGIHKYKRLDTAILRGLSAGMSKHKRLRKKILCLRAGISRYKPLGTAILMCLRAGRHIHVKTFTHNNQIFGHSNSSVPNGRHIQIQTFRRCTFKSYTSRHKHLGSAVLMQACSGTNFLSQKFWEASAPAYPDINVFGRSRINVPTGRYIQVKTFTARQCQCD